MLLAALLKSIVKVGTLKLIDAHGRTHNFGSAEGPSITIRLHERSLHTRLFFNPMLAVGEAFVDGTLTIEDGGDVYDFLDLCRRNMGTTHGHWLQESVASVRRMMRRVAQHHPIGRAQRNVAHHYDLSDTLYELFLDNDRQYSCAYFTSAGDSLEEAQQNKKRHIAAKLLLEPGSRVLDIGSGWGGLALYLSQTSGADVTGVTLSREQHQVSQDRAAASGMAERVRFHMVDYRDVDNQFDRIVSVGMFEHVGAGHYREFFEKIRDLLTDDGVALLHSIGRFDEPGSTNPLGPQIYFPGRPRAVAIGSTRGDRYDGPDDHRYRDFALALCQNAEGVAAKFQRQPRGKIAEIYDDRFCRMWEFYLAGSETSFRHAGSMVFQLQIAKHHDAVPLTRDYIIDWERAQKRRERAA